MSNPSQIYEPGVRYNLSGGLTKSQFEANRKPVPVEQGFIRHAQAAQDAIIEVNLTTRDLSVIVQKPPMLNKQYGFERFNLQTLEEFKLFSGRSAHTPVAPRCYTVTFEIWTLNTSGKRVMETAIGKPLTAIRNKQISLHQTDDGSLTWKVLKQLQKGYSHIINSTGRPVEFNIVVDETAYAKSMAQIEAEKKSRLPDLGGKLIEHGIIAPDADEWFLHPLQRYIVRACGLNRQRSGFFTVAPPNNYEEFCKAFASAGDVVVFLMSEDRDSVVCCSYEYGQIKPVNPDIVVNNRTGSSSRP